MNANKLKQFKRSFINESTVQHKHLNESSFISTRLNELLLNESDVQIKRFTNESEAAIKLPNGNITYTTNAGKTWQVKYVNESSTYYKIEGSYNKMEAVMKTVSKLRPLIWYVDALQSRKEQKAIIYASNDIDAAKLAAYKTIDSVVEVAGDIKTARMSARTDEFMKALNDKLKLKPDASKVMDIQYKRVYDIEAEEMLTLGAFRYDSEFEYIKHNENGDYYNYRGTFICNPYTEQLTFKDFMLKLFNGIKSYIYS